MIGPYLIRTPCAKALILLWWNGWMKGLVRAGTRQKDTMGSLVLWNCILIFMYNVHLDPNNSKKFCLGCHKNLWNLGITSVMIFSIHTTLIIECIHAFTKGQLISEGLVCVFNSSEKRTKNFCPSRQGQKLKFSSSFLGRIEDTKMFFRN